MEQQNKFNPIDWVFTGGLILFWLAFWFCVIMGFQALTKG
jgi:hypothetical protein